MSLHFGRFILVLMAVSAFALLATSAAAKVVNLRDEPFSAAGDGATDDRPALAKALGSLKPADILLVPSGNYRLVLTKTELTIPAGVTLLGQGGQSRFLLASDGGKKDFRSFIRPGTGVCIEGIDVERGEEFPAVLLTIFGDASDITLLNCRVAGNAARFRGQYCHAIEVGVGTLKNLRLIDTSISDCTYGLFQPNPAKGTVDGVIVERCTFERNTASDLEFNSPNGTMRNIAVRDCTFRDNLCPSAGGGFAVGFANVNDASVENCTIRNYGSEALHVEDRSQGIRLSGNTIIGGSLRQPNGVIMVVNNAKKVTIENNIIDARTNTNKAHLILVTAGGKGFANPSEVSVTQNVLVNGPSTQPWYLQPGSGPEPVGNVVTPAQNASNE